VKGSDITRSRAPWVTFVPPLDERGSREEEGEDKIHPPGETEESEGPKVCYSRGIKRGLFPPGPEDQKIGGQFPRVSWNALRGQEGVKLRDGGGKTFNGQ